MGPSVWLIAGPTASGKSALGLRLAEAVGGEIVNADSMQLYADLRVLTARPSPAEEARARHHLYGVADAAEAWSVGRWLAAAQAAVADIQARGRPAILVGGTGLYFHALTEGLAEIPPVPPQARDAASADFHRLGEAGFRTRLAQGDPAAETRISAGDRQRLVRAYSVLLASGRPLSAWQAATRPTLAAGGYAGVVIEPARETLYARCDARVRTMAATGGLEEAAAMLGRGLSGTLPAMKAIGLREFGGHLAGTTELETAIAAAQLQTRRYAKRQSTWFRNQTPGWPRVRGPDPDAQWAELLAAAGRA